MKKKLPALILIVFFAGTMVVFSGCDSINVDGSSSSSQPHEEKYTIGFEVTDSETSEGLEQVSFEVSDMEYENKVVEAGSEQGDYFLTLVEPDSEGMDLTAKRFNYEEKELSIILEETSFTLDDPVELKRVDEDEDDEEKTETLDIEWVDVERGDSPAGIELSYDLEISRYPVTNNQFIEFLNDDNSVEVKKLSDGEAAVYTVGEENFKLLDLNHDYSQIGHHRGEFHLRGWADSEGESIDVSNYPVIEVTWYGAAAFTNWLSEKKGYEPVYDLSGEHPGEDMENTEGYRLPTYEEWEFAAAGGEDGEDTEYAGEDEHDLVDAVWFDGNSHEPGNTDLDEGQGTMEVGLKEPNKLEIYDMSGNVREWTQSPSGESEDEEGKNEIYYMNGSWGSLEYELVVDYKTSDQPSHHRRHIGFRPVRTNSD